MSDQFTTFPINRKSGVEFINETRVLRDEAQAARDAAAADRVQTGLDADATAADRVQTGLDADTAAAAAILAQSAYQGRQYETRAEAVAALNDPVDPYVAPNGTIMTANGLQYLFDSTAGDPIADMPGVVIVGGALQDDMVINIPTDYPTWQAAIDATSMIQPAGFEIELRVEDGHEPTHGLSLRNGGDFSHYRMTYAGTGAIVLAEDFEPVDSSDVPGSTNAIFYYESVSAPRLECLIEGRGTAAYDGLIAHRAAHIIASDGFGVENTRMNCAVREGGSIAANGSRWSRSRLGCMRLTNGVQFSIASATFNDGWTTWNSTNNSFIDGNLHISRGCAGQAQGLIIDGCGAAPITIRRSFVSIIGSSFANIGLNSGSTVNAIRVADFGIAIANGTTLNGVAITEANASIQAFNQPTPAGIVAYSTSGPALGLGALGSDLTDITAADEALRAGFYRWAGDGWGPGTSGGGAIRMDRSTNRGTWIASANGGTSGQNEPAVYLKGTSGAAGDYGPWREVIHTGNSQGLATDEVPAYGGAQPNVSDIPLTGFFRGQANGFGENDRPSASTGSTSIGVIVKGLLESEITLLGRRDTNRFWLRAKDTDGATTGFREIQFAVSGTTAQRPSSRPTGWMYFDTTLGQPIWWDGTAWVDAMGGDPDT